MRQTRWLMAILALVPCALSTQASAAPTARIKPGWMGNATSRITRDPGQRAMPLQSFKFDSWSRQRATYTELGFEVWAPGTTDRDNPSLWKDLDVKLHYRYAGQAGWKSKYVDIAGRSGNNARYAFNLRDVDPFESRGGGTLPSWAQKIPTQTTPDGKAATMEFYFTANGMKLRDAGGANFKGTFVQ